MPERPREGSDSPLAHNDVIEVATSPVVAGSPDLTITGPEVTPLVVSKPGPSGFGNIPLRKLQG